LVCVFECNGLSADYSGWYVSFLLLFFWLNFDCWFWLSVDLFGFLVCVCVCVLREREDCLVKHETVTWCWKNNPNLNLVAHLFFF
jgi:hypothetical protein